MNGSGAQGNSNMTSMNAGVVSANNTVVGVDNNQMMNTISSMIQTDPQQAELLLNKFGDLLVNNIINAGNNASLVSDNAGVIGYPGKSISLGSENEWDRAVLRRVHSDSANRHMILDWLRDIYVGGPSFAVRLGGVANHEEFVLNIVRFNP